MKKKILLITLGIMIFGIGVSAAIVINANQVSYNNKTVEDALNDLYDKANNSVMREELLWENNSPTSSFAAQNITLSKSISNYDYLKITYRTRTTETIEFSVYMSVNDFKKTATDLYWLTGTVSWGTQWPNSPSSRPCKYVDDTTIEFLQNYGGPSNQQGNMITIPLKIYGINGGFNS